jgi:hypothetical protein
MRIAAGVILIIAAVINLFAAFGYMVGGAVVGGAGKLGSMMEEASKKQGRELTDEQKKQFEQLESAASTVKTSGSALVGFGVFLLVTVGTSIAGAVCLFRSKAAKFIIIASALAIGAEVIGSLIIGFGIGKILGLVGGILGILGARSIMAKGAAPAAMPPPAAAPM